MKTIKVERSFIEGKKVLSTGYKIFKNDWSTKHGNYSYGDVKEGDIFTVEGNIKECLWGLHFSENPVHCFNFYVYVVWMLFGGKGKQFFWKK